MGPFTTPPGAIIDISDPCGVVHAPHGAVMGTPRLAVLDRSDPCEARSRPSNDIESSWEALDKYDQAGNPSLANLYC